MLAAHRGAEDASTIRAVTMPDLLRERSEQTPDQIALCVADLASLTFGDWEDRSNSAAHALDACGVGRGSRVALLFTDAEWIAYAVAYLGVLKVGGTAVHLSADLSGDELRRRLIQTKATGMVCGPGLAPPADFAGWTRRAHDLRGKPTPARAELDSNDIADILYTSGTTGPAKAFINPHGTLLFGRRPAGLRRFDGSAPMLAPMPMGTASSAMTAGLMPLTAEATVVVCRPDDIEMIGAMIARYRIATLLLTPHIAMRMVAARLHERHELTSVTTVATASAPLPTATALSLAEMLPGVVITTAYAQGEAVPAVVLGTFDPQRPTALGRPAPGTDVRVAGLAGLPVPEGEIGEIWLRSQAPQRLYLDDAMNAQRLADGWVRTKDLGYLGADGDLYLFDRAVDVIRSGGRLVSSIELEDAVYAHPAVKETAVVGIPGRGGGHTVVAALALDAPDAEPEVLAWLAERLAPYQLPVATHLVDALPRGATGKVLKYQLRAHFADRNHKFRNGVP